MVTLTCPSCGAALGFRSKASVYAVCSYCQSTVVRHDMDVTLVGQVAELQDACSPLQVGTQGAYHGRGFELVGAIQMAWQDGLWTEWCAIYSSGNGPEITWLAEAAGEWAMNSAVDSVPTVPPVEELRPGVSLTLNGASFIVDDIKTARVAGITGELPFAVTVGTEQVSVDCHGPNNRYACVEYSARGVTVYTGESLAFEAFQFRHLRELEGW